MSSSPSASRPNMFPSRTVVESKSDMASAAPRLDQEPNGSGIIELTAVPHANGEAKTEEVPNPVTPRQPTAAVRYADMVVRQPLPWTHGRLWADSADWAGRMLDSTGNIMYPATFFTWLAYNINQSWSGELNSFEPGLALGVSVALGGAALKTMGRLLVDGTTHAALRDAIAGDHGLEVRQYAACTKYANTWALRNAGELVSVMSEIPALLGFAGVLMGPYQESGVVAANWAMFVGGVVLNITAAKTVGATEPALLIGGLSNPGTADDTDSITLSKHLATKVFLDCGHTSGVFFRHVMQYSSPFFATMFAVGVWSPDEAAVAAPTAIGAVGLLGTTALRALSQTGVDRRVQALTRQAINKDGHLNIEGQADNCCACDKTTGTWAIETVTDWAAYMGEMMSLMGAIWAVPGTFGCSTDECQSYYGAGVPVMLTGFALTLAGTRLADNARIEAARRGFKSRVAADDVV